MPLLLLSILIIAGGLLWQRHVRERAANNTPEGVQDINRSEALDALEVEAESINISQPATITSTLGFGLSYDKDLFTISGQVTDPASDSTFVFGEEFSDEETTQPRPYSIVKLRPAVAEDEEIASFLRTGMSVVTNIREDYWDDKVSAGQSQLEALSVWAARSYTPQNNWQETDSRNLEINGYTYAFSEFTDTRVYGQIEVSSRVHQYVTVQDDRPYIITISPIQDDDTSLAMFEAVLRTISYDGLDRNQLSFGLGNDGTFVLSETDGEEAIEDVSNTPFRIDDDTIFDVILRNQPAVVRVGTIRCAELVLVGQSGSEQVGQACSAATGSGSIISEDGYVATNGHVVSINDSELIKGYFALADSNGQIQSRLEGILQFLISEGILGQQDVDEIYSGLSTGQLDVSSFVESLANLLVGRGIATFADDEASFVLQLGTEPLELDVSQGVAEIDTSKTLVAAELIAQDFESNGIGALNIGEGEGSDVAILKAKGDFPIVAIGDIDGLNAGAQLTAIGYPAFVDGGLQTDQRKTTPTVTQGSVLGVFPESETKDNVLITTDVPISGGNSGGPAFDDEGKQIGLNTYARYIDCPVSECFGQGIIRDVKDLQELVGAQDLSLDTTSDISEQWDAALTSYEQSNYKGAARQFDAIDDKYPAHYLATRMMALSESRIGTAGDRSSEFEDKTVRYIVIAAAIVLVVGAAALTAFLVHGSHKHNKLQRPGPAQVPDNPSNVAAVHAPLVAPQAPVAPRPISSPIVPRPQGVPVPQPPKNNNAPTPPKPPTPPTAL